jgi:hypothetical protein
VTGFTRPEGIDELLETQFGVVENRRPVAEQQRVKFQVE